MASAKDIFEQARNERGQNGSEDGAAGSEGDPAEGDGDAGEQGDWEQSNEIPGGGSEQTADATDGESGAAAGSGGSGDEELDRALEGFDGAILAERQIILARSNETAGTRDRPSSGMGGSPTGIGDPGQAPSGSSASGGMPDSGTIPGAQSIPVPSPPGEATAAIDVPEDLPDASDDDVVARQLREAAMNEPDPVLREALWREYRTYKSGS